MLSQPSIKLNSVKLSIRSWDFYFSGTRNKCDQMIRVLYPLFLNLCHFCPRQNQHAWKFNPRSSKKGRNIAEQLTVQFMLTVSCFWTSFAFSIKSHHIYIYTYICMYIYILPYISHTFGLSMMAKKALQYLKFNEEFSFTQWNPKNLLLQ